MSGFLANLIARASQQSPRLERRRPALFEQRGARAVLPAFDDSDRTVGSHEDGASRGRAPSLPDLVQVPARQAPATPVATDRVAIGDAPLRVSRAERAGAQHPVGSERHDMRPSLQHAPLSSAAMPRASSIDDRHESMPSPEPREIRRTSRRSPPTTSESVAAVPTAPLPRARALAAAEPDPAPARQPASRKLVSDLAVQRPTPPRATQIAQAMQLAKAAAPRFESAAAPAAAMPQKTVQITIGRVEVRAVTAPERAAPRAAQKSTARLSLDDYLRDRGRGPR